jgi:hypothetical protein
MKTVATPSSTSTISTHTLLKRYDSRNYTDTIKLNSAQNEKSISFSPTQKVRLNMGTVGGFVTKEAGNFWIPEENYILLSEFSTPPTFVNSISGTVIRGTQIGGPHFNGSLAEIIILGDTVLSSSLLEKIQTQLNSIHGVY